jgi:heme A synthase
VADPDSQPGWRSVLIVALVVVAAVLGAAVLTSLLPTGIQELIFHGPVLIVILIIGTGALLWRVARPSRDRSDGRPSDGTGPGGDSRFGS